MNLSRNLLTLLAMLFLLLSVSAVPVFAQENVGSYTVVAGDSLSSIALRFDVSVETLAAFNQIDDPALIQVGQVLLIPTADDVTALQALDTVSLYALPGETLAALAARTGQALPLLSELNGRTESERLFPGEPVTVPSDQAPAEPLRFGAVRAVDFSDPLIQGRTGMLTVTADRPVFLTAMLSDIPLIFTPVDGDPRQQYAYLPAPALWEPGVYPLTVSYVGGRGMPVARSWPVTVADGNYENQAIVLPDGNDDLLNTAIIVEEETRVNAVLAEVSPEDHWLPIVARPISAEYPTTSPFGTRRSYTGGEKSSFGYHSGQDFAAPADVGVAAPAAGTVVLAEPLVIRGNAVIIDHGRGVFTGYWHLSEIFVEAGEQVYAGDLIGVVGTTGRSTGPHLHWELRIYSVAVDPMQFLNDTTSQ